MGSILFKTLLGAVVLAICFYVTLSIMDLYSPLLDRRVRFSTVVSGKPQVCATAASKIVFEGKICRVSGSNVAVRWDSIANVENAEPACGKERTIKWFRREADQGWNDLFVGYCAHRPTYFETMPNTFDVKDLEMLSPAQ